MRLVRSETVGTIQSVVVKGGPTCTELTRPGGVDSAFCILSSYSVNKDGAPTVTDRSLVGSLNIAGYLCDKRVTPCDSRVLLSSIR